MYRCIDVLMYRVVMELYRITERERERERERF